MAVVTPNLLVTSLADALAQVGRKDLEISKAATWEIAPVNRRDGGTRRWYGIRGGRWTPCSQGGSRLSAQITKEEQDRLPALPEASQGYWVLHFLSLTGQVLEPEIRIDPRHADTVVDEQKPTPPPPPPAFPPGQPGDIVMVYHNLLLELRDDRRQARQEVKEVHELCLTTMREVTANTNTQMQSVTSAIQVLSTAAAAPASENVELRKKLAEATEANTGLNALVAELQHESAVPKMLGEIYSQPGGAEKFNEALMSVVAMTLDTLSGKRTPNQ